LRLAFCVPFVGLSHSRYFAILQGGQCEGAFVGELSTPHENVTWVKERKSATSKSFVTLLGIGSGAVAFGALLLSNSSPRLTDDGTGADTARRIGGFGLIGAGAVLASLALWSFFRPTTESVLYERPD
jgi:hypothetical protein